MARVIFGNIVNSATGKISGNYFSHGRAGYGFLNKRSSKSFKSSASLQAKTILQNTTQKWRTLTDAQRKAWSSQSDHWYNLNGISQKSKMSGYRFFCSCNCLLQRIGLSMINTPGAPSVMPRLQFVSLAASESASTITLTIGAIVPASHNLIFYMTNQVTKGISNPRKTFKLLSVFGSGAGPTLALFNSFNNRYHTPIKSGAKLFLKIALINTSQGFKGNEIIVSCIVGA